MGENVKVIVRCRPMNLKEIGSKCNSIVEIGDYVVSVLNPSARSAPRKSFTFDSVYDGHSKTETIYNDMCYSLVESTLEGYNGTIFAYGQTGCGKTHTMQGDGFSGVAENNGIIQRCFDHIFETISIATTVRYLALVSYLEIYNENIRDLLSVNDPTSNKNHPLKDVPGLGVTVPTLTTQAVMSATDCYNWLNIGNKNRITAATLMNEKSSRSHTIFTISLEQIQEETCSPATNPIIGGIRRGKLNLVDLAGSERQCKTGAFGERLKEATKINLSLSALGNVISALVDGKSKHIPYRDSKLTRLLQDSLGGNTKTLMVSCISSADNSYDETLSTLRYACRAKSISNIPTINEDPKDAQLRQYQEEIMSLKRMLDENQQENILINDRNRELWLEEEKAKMRQQMRDEMNDNETKREQREEREERVEREETEEIKERDEDFQLHARKRIDLIKHALIGGERVDDLQLRERHRMRKLEAQRHLSAIAHALSRMQSEDRDLLQGHYASIQHEINSKNERIKISGQKIKMLEREVADLNSEFQLDREDYLDEIRHLGRNLKFYQLLLLKAQPVLRKHGKNWNPKKIMENSLWNDDIKSWKLPNDIENNIKLPPADLRVAFQKINFIEAKHLDLEPRNGRDIGSTESEDSTLITEESPETYKSNILKNYFRPNRKLNDQLLQRTKSSQVYMRDFTTRKNTPLPINEHQLNKTYKHNFPGTDHQINTL